MTNCIETLSTGVRRLRDGTEIERIPPRHELESAALRDLLRQLEQKVAAVRARFELLLNQNQIEYRTAPDDRIVAFCATRRACEEMDKLRAEVLSAFSAILPSFEVTIAHDAFESFPSPQIEADGFIRIGLAETTVKATPVEWSVPKPLSFWAKDIFELHRNTLTDWFKNRGGNGITVKPVGRKWAVAMKDVPASKKHLLES